MRADAGFDVTAGADVRCDIGYKLWGNLTMTPVSAVTGATVDQIVADPQVRAFCSAAMVPSMKSASGWVCGSPDAGAASHTESATP